jgi:hypothetical protein
MALKRDLKAIFILDLYDILLQIATRNANSEQSIERTKYERFEGRASWIVDTQSQY